MLRMIRYQQQFYAYPGTPRFQRCTLDFLKEYEILRTQGFPIRETIEFSYEPGKCDDIWGKRMRLRDSDVEDRNEEAIAKAKKRAVSLLQKAAPRKSE